jgi:hypothetical protein
MHAGKYSITELHPQTPPGEMGSAMFCILTPSSICGLKKKHVNTSRREADRNNM